MPTAEEYERWLWKKQMAADKWFDDFCKSVGCVITKLPKPWEIK